MSDKIFDPHENDVLCARGKLAMNWPGNVFYNKLIKCNRHECYIGDNNTKNQLAACLVNHINSLSPPGRFLKIIDNEWIELEHVLAIRKTRQALREGSKHFATNIFKDAKNHATPTKIQSHVKSNLISHEGEVEQSMQNKVLLSRNITPKDGAAQKIETLKACNELNPS